MKKHYNRFMLAREIGVNSKTVDRYYKDGLLPEPTIKLGRQVIWEESEALLKTIRFLKKKAAIYRKFREEMKSAEAN